MASMHRSCRQGMISESIMTLGVLGNPFFGLWV